MSLNEKSYEYLPDLPPPPAAAARSNTPQHYPDEGAFDYSHYLPTQYIPPALSSAATDFFRRLPALPAGFTPSALGPSSRAAHLPSPNAPAMRDSLNPSRSKLPIPQYHKPRRAPSPPLRPHSTPISPPPLTPIVLTGFRPSTASPHRLLTPQLAEEIRLLIPPRHQLHAAWKLLYASSQDGTSLSTLYARARDSEHVGFVLLVRDARGGCFGAYLSDPPRVRPGYFGTGECFLWQATVLPELRPRLPRMLTASGMLRSDAELDAEAEAEILRGLPPPPSADGTERMGRSTTFRSPVRADFEISDAAVAGPRGMNGAVLQPTAAVTTAATAYRISAAPNGEHTSASTGMSTPSERIRFRAFPYSGVNDFMIHCDRDYISVGGGDGRYGLWLNELLDTGISQRCPSFGNEPLSEQGDQFEVLGVEFWAL